MHGILVVDNCPRNVHDRLLEVVQHRDSKLSLITIDYEPELIGGSFPIIELRPEYVADVIPRILRRLPEAMGLNDHDLERIAKYCQGFPQLAVLLAKSKAPMTLDQLNEREFAKRLLWGRGEPDPHKQRALAALSLFKYVGAAGDACKQLNFVAQDLCQSSERDLKDLIRSFRSSRVIQVAGDYLIVAPEPIAVALAAEWWQNATKDELLGLLPLITASGLLEPFCERCRTLTFSENCREITQQLMGANGPFREAEVLFSESGSRLFRAFARLNPTISIDALECALKPLSIDQLRNLRESRRNIVWTLEKLAWEPHDFGKAARILLRLACAENETWGNNATGVFKQLFQLMLSGTKQPAMDRLIILTEGIASKDPTIERTCVDALVEALAGPGSYFSRNGEGDIDGYNAPQKDWGPKTWAEAEEYNLSAFLQLKQIALRHDKGGQYAKATLGKNISRVLTPRYLGKVIADLNDIAKYFSGYWPEAKGSIQNYLEYHSAESSAADVELLNELLVLLQPNDFHNKLAQIVTHGGYVTQKLGDGKYVSRSEEAARALGKELSEVGGHWLTELSTVMNGKQDQAFAFGEGLAEFSGDRKGLMTSIMKSLREVPQKERNPSALRGFMSRVDDETFEYCLNALDADCDLCKCVPYAITARPLQARDLFRLRDGVMAGRFQGEDLRYLCYGRVTESLVPAEMHEGLISIAEAKPEYLAVVYDVYVMYTHQNEERLKACSSDIYKLFMSEGFLTTLSTASHADAWRKHSIQILKSGNAQEFAENQTRQIVQAASKGMRNYAVDMTTVLAEIFQTYGSACWPIVGEALKGPKRFMYDDLIQGDETHYREKMPEVFKCTLWSLDINVLVTWCQINAGVAPHIIRRMALFTTNDDGSLDWHPMVLELFRHCWSEDFPASVKSNLRSFGSVGSRVPYLRRRLDLCRKLENLSPIIKEFALDLMVQIEKEIEYEVKRDEEYGIGILS